MDERDYLAEKRSAIRSSVAKPSRRDKPALLSGLITVLFLIGIVLASYDFSPGEAPAPPEEKKAAALAQEKPKQTATSEPAKAPATTTSLIPPTFEESKLSELVIIDDDQASFWSNLQPEYVYLSDSKDKVKGTDALKIDVLAPNRDYGVLIQKVFSPFEDWSDVEYLGFWFKGNNTGIYFELLVYFDKSWKRWVKFRFKDNSKEWRRLVFSTRTNLVKQGEVDWSRVWIIRLTNTNKSVMGSFYFDRLSLYLPKGKRPLVTAQVASPPAEAVNRTFGIGDTITKGQFSVTLDWFYDDFEVVKGSGAYRRRDFYSRVDVVIENVGSEAKSIKFAPHPPALLDDLGNQYTFVKIKHSDEIDLSSLYPGGRRKGAIFFEPWVSYKAKSVRLILYVNKGKYEFVFDRF